MAKCHIGTITTIKLSKREKNSMLQILDEISPITNPFEFLCQKVCDIQMHAPNLAAFALSTDGDSSAIILNKNGVAGIIES